MGTGGLQAAEAMPGGAVMSKHFAWQGPELCLGW